MSQHLCDIAIIGGGYVGSVAALLLAQKGFSVTLLGAECLHGSQKDTPEDPRTFAIMASVTEWLFPLLCDTQQYQCFQPIASAHISCEGSKKVVSIEHHVSSKNIAYAITAQDLQRILFHNITHNKKISALPAKAKKWVVHDHAVEITLLDDSVCTAQIMCGADGRDSFVRSASGIHSSQSSFPQKALVFTTNSLPDIPHHYAYEHFFPQGNVALLPHASQESWGWVWIDTPARIECLSSASPEAFSRACYAMIDAFLPLTPNRPLLQHKSAPLSYGLQGHIADTFIFPRGVLLGDAACTLHPVAAQGLNIGLHGVHHLACTLTSHKNMGMEWWDWPTLLAYEKYHRPFTQRMSWAMAALVYSLSLQRFPTKCPVAWSLFSEILSYTSIKKHLWQFI